MQQTLDITYFCKNKSYINYVKGYAQFQFMYTLYFNNIVYNNYVICKLYARMKSLNISNQLDFLMKDDAVDILRV